MPRYKLTIDLDIDLDDTPEVHITDGLYRLAVHAAAEGLFTGATNATVTSWDYNVEKLDHDSGNYIQA
jgi:hypothetical protein